MYLSCLRFEAFLSWIIFNLMAQMMTRYNRDLAIKFEIYSFGQWGIFQDPSIIPLDVIACSKQMHIMLSWGVILGLLTTL